MPGRVHRIPGTAQDEATRQQLQYPRPTVEPSVRRTSARTVDTLPLRLMHWLRALIHSAPVVPRHSILSPMSGVFPLWRSCHLYDFTALGQGCPLNVLIVSWYFCQMAGSQLLSNDRLSGQPARSEHTTGRWSRPTMLTPGLCWNLSKGSAQTLLAPGALGAAEAGPGRSLDRWGMGKGMAMPWARGKLLNAHCSPVGLIQVSCHLGDCYGSRGRGWRQNGACSDRMTGTHLCTHRASLLG